MWIFPHSVSYLVLAMEIKKMKTLRSFLVLFSLILVFFYSCQPEKVEIIPVEPICKECYSSDSTETAIYCEMDFESKLIFELSVDTWEATYGTTCTVK